MHKILYIAVKNENILVNILLLNGLCQNEIFLLKKRMKEIFAYHVLEFMLTLAKMQNNNTLM